MLKLIIADDEKWVRTAIKSMIPFEDLKLVLSSEAANGIEALELCRIHEPHILLTDIMMPGLNGLELINELAHILPEIKIIVISGYNDFEYAKTAMKYGVKDYLLKPVDERELIQVLERLKNELEISERLKREKETEQEQYKKALPVMCETFLSKLISRNSMTAENIRSEAMAYGIDLSGSSFTVCVTAADISPQYGMDISPQNGMDAQAGAYFRTILKRTMKRYVRAVTFPLENDRSVLVSIITGKNEETVRRAYDIGRRLMLRRHGIDISVGISSNSYTPCMLQNLYSEAVEALDTRFWQGPGTFAGYTPGSLSADPKLSLQEDMLNKIILNIKLSNLQTAISYMESVSASLRGEPSPDFKPALVKEFYWQFIQSVIIMLSIQLPFIRQETVVSGQHPYDRIRSTAFFTDLEDYVKELLQHIFDFYHDKNPEDSTNLIENAKKVIESNYAGDISLEQVARHVHLSPAYLSELFKKQTGMSFIDYKTIVRIENAKKLLMTPSVTISEVSTRVGYTDPKYFSKLFKKITGKTIYEFRKGL